MMSNMTLGKKIGMGFGIILLIAIILGGFSVWNMSNVKQSATVLAKEYVPEVDIANNIERYSIDTMYEIRGYAFTDDENFLNLGLKKLEIVKKNINDAKALASKSSDLSKLKDGTEKIEAKVLEYEQLLKNTTEKKNVMESNRKKLDEAESVYMKNCDDFLADQNAFLSNETKAGEKSDKLLERQLKITLISKLIDLGNETTIATFKAQANRDPKIIEDAQKNFDAIEKKLNDLVPITHQEANIKMIADIKEAAKNYKLAMNELITNWIADDEIRKKRQDVGEGILALAKAIDDTGTQQTTTASENSVSALSTSSTLMVVGLIFAIILGVIMAVFITVGITKQINRIVYGLSDGAEQVSSASTQVSRASQQLAEGATEQASSLEESSSALEELASQSKNNSDLSNQANQLMRDTKSMVEAGSNAMKETSETMGDIKTSSYKVSSIAKTIEEIAFQTNLLALNAAVEAARAGEHGKGFAVVAEEVRNLAKRASQASKEAGELIEHSLQSSNKGAEVVKKASESLDQITVSASKVADIVAEISVASAEQSRGIEQINTAVKQMDQITQQVAANSEESASASEELASQAEQVLAVVQELAKIVGQVNVNENSRELTHKGQTFHSANHADNIHRVINKIHPHQNGNGNGNGNGKNKKLATVMNSAKVIPLDEEEVSEMGKF